MCFSRLILALCCLALAAAAALSQDRDRAPAPPSRPRARDLGLILGTLQPGPNNAVTDVEGVEVGHVTIFEGDDLRTGLTAILPHSGNLFLEKVPAAVYVGNGFGKLAGSTQIEELGEIETPILLTGTLSVPRAADGLITYMLSLPGMENVRSINPVVGETNDGGLSDIRRRPITAEHVRRAIESAAGGPVREGCIGAGAGTVCFGFKGGIGTASRRVGAWMVGVLVQSNFGGILSIGGLPVGPELERQAGAEQAGKSGDGSIMIVVATDAPLSDRNLRRLAGRALLGVARTGGYASNGSGDYVIAFTTHPGLRRKPDDRRVTDRPELGNNDMSPLFLATVEATEEAIINSLFTAVTVTGQGRTVEALPVDKVMAMLEGFRREREP